MEEEFVDDLFDDMVDDSEVDKIKSIPLEIQRELEE
tara:strand:+ start:106 stop:213 length:108 start_codon:yes stop_codon:yes gene_type:complete